MTILPGLVYLRMDAKDKLPKKISTSLIVSLMILLFISTKITVLPVIFTHSVIKLSGISDFSTHSYIIKSSEYPEEFFSNSVWDRKKSKQENITRFGLFLYLPPINSVFFALKK